ncbi:MAG: hypothetical protein ACLPKB_00960 [Xanthobacteraceae bacterium]
MRHYSACVALVCGVASLAGISTASAGCGCGAPVAYLPQYAVTSIYVAQPVLLAQPVLVAQPIPQPIYVVNQGTYPYVHGYEFYRSSHYYGGGWHGWRYARHFGPMRHYYGPLEK